MRSGPEPVVRKRERGFGRRRTIVAAVRELGRGWEYRVYEQRDGRALKIPRGPMDRACRVLSTAYHDGKIPAAHELAAQVLKAPGTISNLEFLMDRLARVPRRFIALLGNPVALGRGRYTQDLVTPLGIYLKEHAPRDNRLVVLEYAALVRQLWEIGLADSGCGFPWNCGVDSQGSVIQMDVTELTWNEQAVRDSVYRRTWLRDGFWRERADTLAIVKSDLDQGLSMRSFEALWCRSLRTDGGLLWRPEAVPIETHDASAVPETP
jgi:hypothetical protein